MKGIREREEEGQAFSAKKTAAVSRRSSPAGVLTGIFHWTNLLGFCNLYHSGFDLYLFYRYVPVPGDRQKGGGRQPQCFRRRMYSSWEPWRPCPLPAVLRTMVSGIAFSKYHTVLYQFLILWGLPFALVLILLLAVA